MKLIYDKQKLYEILKEFNTVTGVRISFLEEHDAPVIGIPGDNCELCSFKQRDESFYKKCKECDRSAFNAARKSNDFYIYECHYNLVEAIQPVTINGETLGYFLFGQVLTNKEAFIKKNAPSDYETELLNKLSVTSIDALKSYAKILSWVISYTIMNNDIRVNHRTSFLTISGFIEQNCRENLTVDLICREFHYSRSALFSIFMKECGTGVMEYVNSVRLQKSLSLLQNYKVSEVAAMVGIPDNNYFSRLFKKKYGITPSQFKSGAPVNKK